MPVGSMTDVKAEQPEKQYVGSAFRDAGRTTVFRAVQFWKVPSVVMLSGIVMCVSLVKPVNTFCVEVTDVK